ncbi:MAG: hypothetical protein ACKPKO_36725, partial [Candidatus Fonsibacter sp.]
GDDDDDDCEAEHIVILSYLENPILQNRYTGYLLGVGGLMQAMGGPLEYLIFADLHEGKAEPFIAHDLTHVVDGVIDAITSIRVSCLHLNRSPLLALGAHAKGGRNL